MGACRSIVFGRCAPYGKARQSGRSSGTSRPIQTQLRSAGLRSLIDEFQPDVVHSYGWISYSVAAALAGKDIPLLLSARDYGYSCATRSLVYRGVEPCSGPALQKCLSCAPSLYGLGKGWAAVLGVAGGGALLRSKVDGIHSISTYVQEIVRRDFLRRRSEHGRVRRRRTRAIHAVGVAYRSDHPQFSRG